MARGKRRDRKGLLPENIADHAEGDFDKETIENLSKARAKENAKIGHNSKPPPEVLTRNFDAIELAIIEMEAAQRIVQKARQAYGATLKTAKTDCGGSKSWVASLVESVQYKRKGEKGGNGEIVTSHQQIGEILRLKGVPLGTQFQLFAVPETDADGAKVDATALGEQAGREGAPKDNNPYTPPGSPDWFAWNNGWQVGQDTIAETLGRGNGAEATH